MLTGKRAFAGADAAGAPAALLDCDPVPASLLQSLAPLDHLVRRCLAKNPAERWQTATDVMHELKWIAQTALQSRNSVPIRQESDQAIPGASEQKDKGQEIRWFRPVTALIGALITTVAIAIWLSTQGTRTSDEPPLTFFIDAPDGTRFGLATMMPAPALAPDARHLAFVAPFRSENSVWVQTLGSLDARHQTGTNRAAFPFWSPDGRFVAFGAAGRLKRISAAGGGAPQDLATTDGLFAGGVWSRNGTIIFSDNKGLSRVSSAGGEKTLLTRIDEAHGETAHRFPVLLPDGQRFIYLVLGTRDEYQGLYLGSLSDPGLKRRVVATDANGALGIGPDGRDYLFFVRDSTLLAQPFDSARGELNGDPIAVARPIEPGEGGRLAPFAVSGRVLVYRPRFRPKTQLAWVTRRGIPEHTLGLRGAYYRSPSLSPEETKVAVSHLDERTGVEDIWWFDLRRNVSERLTTEPIAARVPGVVSQQQPHRLSGHPRIQRLEPDRAIDSPWW